MINGYGINGHINYFPTSKFFSNQSPSRQEIFSGWWEAPKPRWCPQRSWRSPWPSGRSSCASSAEIPRRWPWRFPRPVTWWNWKFCWFVCWFLCVVLGWVRWFMFLLFNLEIVDLNYNDMWYVCFINFRVVFFPHGSQVIYWHPHRVRNQKVGWKITAGCWFRIVKQWHGICHHMGKLSYYILISGLNIGYNIITTS